MFVFIKDTLHLILFNNLELPPHIVLYLIY